MRCDEMVNDWVERGEEEEQDFGGRSGNKESWQVLVLSLFSFCACVSVSLSVRGKAL